MGRRSPVVVFRQRVCSERGPESRFLRAEKAIGQGRALGKQSDDRCRPQTDEEGHSLTGNGGRRRKESGVYG